MPRLKAANNARTILTQAIDATVTSFTVADASIFPDPPFRITIDDEIMEVGAKDNTTNTFSNVIRGMENTVPASHNNGAYVENRFTAGTLAELIDANEAQAKVDAHAILSQTHGVGTGYYIAKTSRNDQLPAWADIPDKPTAFNPTVHKTTHAIGGADALTPADIGAVKNTAGVPELLADVLANRPTPGVVGRLFFATDTGEIYRDNGTTWDLAAASRDGLAAHLAETVIKQNLTINVPADYPTIQAALNALKYAWIPKDVTVTIQVAAGTYTHTSPIVVDHPCGSRIQIIGATPITTTITGVGTISGSAGNWSVPITVANVTGIQVGQYAIIRNTSGTGDHFAHRGIWEITAVDTATKTVTVKNTHTASTFPTATLSGGDFIVLTTILKFTDCIGLRLFDKSLGYLDKVAIVGNNSASTTVGIDVGYYSWTNIRGGTIYCGNYVGANGFTTGFAAGNGGSIVGNSLVASGNGSHGFYALNSGSISASSSTASGNGSVGFLAQYSGSISASSSTASGNASHGFLAQYSGSISASSSTASGNGSHGFYAQYSGSISASSSTASGNASHGFYALNSGSIYASSSTASGNGSHGFYALNSGSIYAFSSTASGNATDYKAEKMGYIYCAGYAGTPTFSPAVNTEGNYNAIITT